MKRTTLFFLFLFTIQLLKGQSISQFHLYSYNQALFNPAVAGAENKHIVAVQGQYFMDDKLFEKGNPYTGLISYEGNIKSINSGIGAMIVTDKIGVYSTKKMGLSYNYKINLSPSSVFRIGVRPTISRHVIKFSDIIFGDQMDSFGNPIDPLVAYPEKETQSKADLDVGMYFNSFGFYAGISLSNVFKHEYESNAVVDNVTYGDEFSDRLFMLLIGKKINLPVIKIDPSIALIKNEDYAYLFLNNNLVIKNLILVGGTFSKSLHHSEYYDFSINGGVSIVNRVELIALFYSRQSHRPETSSDYKFFEGMIRVKI
ncbi:MAG TPA: PorP/SprF family type IX secretion system membrane protein [Cytophagales bacterium]|nr:PorP/SprF family type IX secretion system membrane protein [Cytophagales bacterium]